MCPISPESMVVVLFFVNCGSGSALQKAHQLTLAGKVTYG
jgi:hypothetical protein